MPIEKSRLGPMTSRTDIPKNLNKACLVCLVRAFSLPFLEPRERGKTENRERLQDLKGQPKTQIKKTISKNEFGCKFKSRNNKSETEVPNLTGKVFLLSFVYHMIT